MPTGSQAHLSCVLELLIPARAGMGNVPVSDGLTLLHIAFNLVIIYLFSKNGTITEC